MMDLYSQAETLIYFNIKSYYKVSRQKDVL